MSRLTLDGTAVSRDQILRRKRGQGKYIFIFPVQLTTTRIGNLTRLILTIAICDDHTYIQIHTRGAELVAALLSYVLLLCNTVE